MKVAERIIDRESTIQGEKVSMSIDPTAFAHIMSVLTDLYSDPELAVIREYSTNARDAQIEAGIDRPIEVSTPGPLTPFLTIRDYGIGLDAEGIRETYSQYGASTKRGSNDVVGMLGLGCKSALTYTDQFTVIGRKNGREIQVAIGRDEDGAGSMTIVSDEPTDEPNGVEVLIPARRNNDIEAKARAFFRFWPEGSVLLNGAPVERIDGMWLTDRIVVPARDVLDQHYIVMGGVPYPVPTEGGATSYYNRNTLGQHADGNGTLVRLPDSRFAAIFVDIGEVHFTPSREALQMNKHTKATIDRVGRELAGKFEATLAAEVAKAKTPREAMEATLNVTRLGLPIEKAIWNGHPVKLSIHRTKTYDHNGQQRTVQLGRGDDMPFLLASNIQGYNYRRKTGDWNGTFDLLPRDGRDRIVVFDGWDGAALTETKRAKTIQYLDQHTTLDPNTERHSWVFVKTGHDLTADEARWVEHRFKWADVEAMKLPASAKTGKTKATGTYWWTTPDRDGYRKEEISADKIDPAKTVYYHGNTYSASHSTAIYAGLIPADFKVICLEANRLAKFKRDFPTIPSVNDYATAHAAKVIAKVDGTKLAAARYKVEGDGRANALALVADRVLDPEIRKAAEYYALDTTEAEKVLKLHARWAPDKTLPKVNLSPFGSKYPFLPYSVERKHAEHMLLYVNAVYTAEGGN